MRRDLILALCLKAAGGLGWLLLVAVLSQRLETDGLGRVLYGFALISLFGGLAAAGWSQSALRFGPGLLAVKARRPLVRLLAGGVLCIMVVSALTGLGAAALAQGGNFPLLPAPIYLGFAVFLLATGNLFAALLRATGAIAAPLLALGLLRAGGPLLVGLVASEVTPTQVFSAYLLTLGLGTIGLGLRFGGLLARLEPGTSLSKPAQVTSQWGAGIAWILFQNLDILVIGLILNPATAAGYLVARRVAGVLTLAVEGCRAALAPRFARAFEAGPKAFADLARQSGRLILGFGAVLVFLVALPGVWLLPDARLLLWLLAAQSTPLLFGLTGTMMAMSDLQVLRLLILLGAVGLSAPVFALAALGGPLPLAAAVAGGQLLLGALCARVLWRARGVVPPIAELHFLYIPAQKMKSS